MISIQHALNRAEKTRDMQVSLVEAPGWVWTKKPVVSWDGDIIIVVQLISTESVKRTQWRNSAEVWQSDIDTIQSFTRQVVGIGRVQFSNDPVKLALLDRLHTDGASRADIYEQGVAARDTWQEIAPLWEISPAVTLGAFSSLLANSLVHKQVHGRKETAWRRAEAELTIKAQALDRCNIEWYAEATRRFAETTVEGATIRRTVPTTARPEKPVGQPVISHLMTSGGDIHFDCAAPHATQITYLHQAPGAEAFVVVAADSEETSLTLHHQPPGLHRFKAIGRNSHGEGPESAVAEITLAAAQTG